MAEEEGALERAQQMQDLVEFARGLTRMSPQQKRIFGVIAGLGGGVAIIAALRNEKFRELLKQAGDDAMEFTEETGKDVWGVLTREIPELGERATARFGQNVLNPFFGEIGDLLAQTKPLSEFVNEGISTLGRLRRELGDAIGGRLFSGPQEPQP